MRPGDDARRREGEEPSEAPRNVPWIIALLTACVAVWGSGYFWMYAGDGSVNYGDQRSLSALAAPVAQEGQIDGEAVFTTNCAACHQATGLGLAGAFPPLAASEWVTGPPERPISIVLHGLQGAISVAGQDYASVMPAQALDDAEIAAVLTYIRSAWGNAASAVTPAQVAAVREQLDEREGAIQGQAELQTLFP